MLMSFDRLDHIPPFDPEDCRTTCHSLCCVSIGIDQQAGDFKDRTWHIVDTKPAGKFCQHLVVGEPKPMANTKCGDCTIYDDRTDKGFRRCPGYDCGGAGAFISALFEDQFGFHRLKPPENGTPGHNLWQAQAESMDVMFKGLSVAFTGCHKSDRIAQSTVIEATRSLAQQLQENNGLLDDHGKWLAKYTGYSVSRILNGDYE